MTDDTPTAVPEAQMGRTAMGISAATMTSRLLGFCREMLLAALLGATSYADAFLLAYKIPNLGRDLFAEGALSSAFVPTFADTLKRKGRDEAVRFANAIVGLVLLVVGTIAILGMVFAHEFVPLITGFSDSETTALATTATRILFPFLPIISLAAVAMGQLNAQRLYKWPALAPATFNVIAVGTGLVLLLTDAPRDTTFIVWACATVAGGLGQLLVQVPALYKTGYRFRPRIDLACTAVRRVGRLITPAVLGLAAMNINVMISAFFASQDSGAVSWLSYSFRLIYLPLGVFGVAIATICTTRLAHRAAEHDHAGMAKTLSEGLGLVAFLTVPSAIGLALLGEPIARLLFERGEFLATDSAATGAALTMYCIGLPAYAAVKVVAPAFYALDRSRVPLIASLAAVTANLVAIAALYPSMGFRGLALGTSLAALVNVVLLLAAFRSVVGSMGSLALARHLLAIVASGIVAGVVAWLAFGFLAPRIGERAAVPVAIVLSVLEYAGVAHLLRLPELTDVLSVVRRRRAR